MDKKKLNSLIFQKTFWAIFATICFVAGIPTIILCAKNSTIGLIAGILMVVFGFYGTPLFWISFGQVRELKRIIEAIYLEKLTSVKEISTQLTINPEQVKTQIQKAISQKLLIGFLFDGNELKNNEKLTKNIKASSKCTYCGGTLSKTEDGFVCNYCGSKFEK